MTTTVTTVTITTVTATAAASLVLIAILALLALLIQKEIIGGMQHERAHRLAKQINIAIVPLVVVFVASVAVKIADVLQ